MAERAALRSRPSWTPCHRGGATSGKLGGGGRDLPSGEPYVHRRGSRLVGDAKSLGAKEEILISVQIKDILADKRGRGD